MQKKIEKKLQKLKDKEEQREKSRKKLGKKARKLTKKMAKVRLRAVHVRDIQEMLLLTEPGRDRRQWLFARAKGQKEGQKG